MIYIGKARSLQNRLKSYFLPNVDAKIRGILSETKDIEFLLTGSEREAAFLEINLIQQHQPKFNLRLKDDKSFPYLKLTTQERFPGIYLTRRVEPDGAQYYGPFSPANQARITIHLLNKYFGIRACEEKIPGRRQRPCLEYDLDLCSAPCTKYISEAEYQERVKNALLFLEGKVEELLKILKRKMKDAAQAQEYEEAAHWRDLILSLEQIKDKPRFISIRPEDKDIFGFARGEEEAFLFVFLMRKGKVIETQSVYDNNSLKEDDSAILSKQLVKFYEEQNSLPEKIILPFRPKNCAEMCKNISGLTKRKITITHPSKGKDRRLVELANKNARMMLDKKPAGPSAMEEMKDILRLKSGPVIIEGYDISNTGGQESVGSLVVFINGSPLKQAYRKYKVKTVEGPNDVASLYEVLYRRFSKLKKDKDMLPDLILVDGGKGQLKAAKAALGELGFHDIPVISIAKKEEIIYSELLPQGLRLDRTSPALQLVQRIRDEAHRFALAFHKQRRKKRSFSSILDSAPGIGPIRKKLLLERYLSIDDIRSASESELAQLIGTKTAQALLKHLKK